MCYSKAATLFVVFALFKHVNKLISVNINWSWFAFSYYLEESPKNDDDTWLHIQRQFIVLQLLELTEVFDLADEMGRQVNGFLIFFCLHYYVFLVEGDSYICLHL